MKYQVTCNQIEPRRRGTLAGMATLTIGSIGLAVRYVAVHDNGSKQWVQLPSVPVLDAAGNTVRDPATGKVRYVYAVDFHTSEQRREFSNEAVAAIRKFDPSFFEVAP